jgi:hypothetical protein
MCMKTVITTTRVRHVKLCMGIGHKHVTYKLYMKHFTLQFINMAQVRNFEIICEERNVARTWADIMHKNGSLRHKLQFCKASQRRIKYLREVGGGSSFQNFLFSMASGTAIWVIKTDITKFPFRITLTFSEEMFWGTKTWWRLIVAISLASIFFYFFTSFLFFYFFTLISTEHINLPESNPLCEKSLWCCVVNFLLTSNQPCQRRV